MEFLIDNWMLIVVFFCCLFLVFRYGKRFFELPTEEQLEKAQEWLLFAVIQAEKELGSGTGSLKLRSVYDLFIQRFPMLSRWVSFEQFNVMVYNALDEMRDILDNNKKVRSFVEGKDEP